MERKVAHKKFGIPGMRYLFTAAACIGYTVIYASRCTISVAIVAMVNNSIEYNNTIMLDYNECKNYSNPFSNETWLQESVKDGEFSWSPKLQGIILGSFYYGYTISPLIGGRLAELFSGKWVLGLGILVTSLLTLLTPVVARYSITLLIITRAVAGFFEGVALPSFHMLFGTWLPDSERTFLSSIAYSGVCFGIMAGSSLSGILCKSKFFGGWPSAFYTMGLFGCIWFLLFVIFISNSPSTSHFIKEKELKYITSDQSSCMTKKISPIKWQNLFSSIPLWSVIAITIGTDWYFYTLLSNLPTYFGTILHFDIKNNGLITALLAVPTLVTVYFAGWLSDVMIRKNFVSRVCMRKSCCTIAGFGAIVLLLGVCLSRCNVILCIVFLMIGRMTGGFISSGYVVASIELCPQYAGTVIGIANTLSSMTGFLAPLVVGILTNEEQSFRQWDKVFGITAAILFTSTLIFIICYSTEDQNWSKEKESRKKINIRTEIRYKNSTI